MNAKQQILNLTEAEKRERAKRQLFEYLFTGDRLAGIATDDDLETIMNICQNGSDAGRALSELQGEFDMLLDIMRNMRTQQKTFFTALHGTLIRANAMKESRKWEQAADQFIKDQDTPPVIDTTPTLF